MQDELSIEIGQFDSEFLIDFITDKLGAVYYNKGVEDAKAVIERRMLEMSDELYEIEQSINLSFCAFNTPKFLQNFRTS